MIADRPPHKNIYVAESLKYAIPFGGEVLKMKVMRKEEIPAFVAEIASTGCNITGLAGAGYIVGDADLPTPVYRKVLPELRRILESYGFRDHLLTEISNYLISIGRSYPPPTRH